MERSQGAAAPSRNLVVAPGGLGAGGRRVASWASSPTPNRQLTPSETAQLVASLPSVDLGGSQLHLQAIFDLSGSMWGGNDALGLRFELFLIAAQKLVTSPGRTLRRRQQLSIETMSFDLNTHIDLPVTRADRRGLATVEQALLSAPLGGSSALGPALRHAETTRTTPCLRVLMTDFELLDPNPAAVIADAASSKVEHTLALAFRSPPPAALTGERVTVHRIDPDNDDRTVVARHIVDAALIVAGKVGAT